MKRILSILILFLLATISSTAQVRRHIIVLQDNSGSYYNSSNEPSISNIQNQIVALFQNNTVGNDNNLLNKEKDQGVIFYNEKFDEVSFYWFVADQPDNVSFYSSKTASPEEFEKNFFKPGGYKQRGDGMTISDFIRNCFEQRPPLGNRPNNYRLSTYSFSAFAYPLCMDVLRPGYAEEYIVIIISDFKAGSVFGNRNDETILRNAFKEKAQKIIERVDCLNSGLFRIDYFDYYLSAKGGLIGFVGYKIHPFIGSDRPENVDLRINSNIELTQRSFGDDLYRLKYAEIIFDHNDKVNVSKASMSVNFSDGTRSIVDITDKLTRDPIRKAYVFKNVDVRLDNKTDPTQNFSGELEFNFFVDYSTGGDNDIHYIYKVGRNINEANYDFRKKLSNVQILAMFLLIVIMLAVATAWILHLLGKPQGIVLHWHRFNDNYETIDFSPEGAGRVHTDYHAWNPANNDRGISIRVDGRYTYKYPKRFFNWKEQTGFPVTITPATLESPQGFTMYLATDSKVTNSPNIPIVVDTFENGKFSFKVVIKKESYLPLEDVLPFGFQIEVVAKNVGTFRKFYYSKRITYSFHIGPELGNVWVGVDPGTTGSCIATATEVEDLTIQKDRDGNDLITPSAIVIKNGELNDSNEDSIRGKTLFGTDAGRLKLGTTERYSKFVSIKKYLGYNETFELKGADNTKIHVKSSLLSTLLIEGLFNQQKEFLESKPKEFERFLNSKTFSPRRAVFAIPNNFTASKIQHLKYCIQSSKLTTLKDIRFIYEAEAILVNYIHGNQSALQSSPMGETVFVFDMGGATINATLANVKRRGNEYDISIIAKLGYGIGGDTIDYAILKWIFSKERVYPFLAEKDPFTSGIMATREQRITYIEKLLDIKRAMINNYPRKDRTFILDRDSICDLLELEQWQREVPDQSKDVFNNEIKKDSKNFLHGKIFKELIWSNIEDIVKDILIVCKDKNISELNTVIMSGRSSHFPRVSEVVEKAIKPFYSNVSIHLLGLTESKSAVAKGACYYGVENARIHLRNRGVNGVFGVIQTLRPDAPPIFHRLISDGAVFRNGVASGSCPIDQEREFVYNGRKVRFCQVMGVDAEKAIANREKHKYTEIASIMAQPYAVKRVQISVTEKDKVICSVTDVNGDVQKPVEGMVNDADIIACNDEQYTFFIK